MGDFVDTAMTEWVTRLRANYPQAVAIVLRGSHAQGTAGPNSDVDFDVLLAGEPYEAWPMYLEREASGRIRHVSVAVHDVTSWLADEEDPSDWAFGLGTRSVTRLLWAKDEETKVIFQSSWREHPAAEPELEDFIEGYGKVRNALHRDDELDARQAARSVAELAPTLLRLVNPEIWPGTRREALDAVLDFPVAPEGYREAMLRCLGLSGGASTGEEVLAATRLLVEGVIRVLRESSLFEREYPEGEPFGLLANGMIEAYLEQMRSSESRSAGDQNLIPGRTCD